VTQNQKELASGGRIVALSLGRNTIQPQPAARRQELTAKAAREVLTIDTS